MEPIVPREDVGAYGWTLRRIAGIEAQLADLWDLCEALQAELRDLRALVEESRR